jgi:hypothetical protein
LHEHRTVLNPDAIYRAKLWGRVERKQVQPELLDLHYLPLVERDLGEKVARLLEDCFGHLRGELGWSQGEGMSPRQAEWLVKAPFWLLAAKILRDKRVPGFKNIDIGDFESTFGRLARHYQSKDSRSSPVTVAKEEERALSEVATLIDRFYSLELMSTEALGHIYESAIINKETRKRWGTHSTPVWLIDYMLGRLRPLIIDMPSARRRVFEPAMGHGGFLVAALRVLDELMPAEDRPHRKDYLRKRLSGVDVDPFSQEIARLALTLADVPNANGWSLRCEDMYDADVLEHEIGNADIVLANPPFKNFSASDRPVDSLVNKAAEVVRQTVRHLPRGGIFGFVLPQTFLGSKEGIETRRRMVNECEVTEITLFADKVFEFGEPESVVILGHKPAGGAISSGKALYQRVREKQVSVFKETYEPSSAETFSPKQILRSNAVDFTLRVLGAFWEALDSHPRLEEHAEAAKGFEHEGESKVATTIVRFSEKQFEGARAGFMRWQENQTTHTPPHPVWLNLNKDVIRTPGSGTTTGVAQVLLNYARISRGEWRLKALLDRRGHPVSSNFLTIRPRRAGVSIEALWGILNSPLANAYAFCVSSKRHVLTRDMRNFPVPGDLSQDRVSRLEAAVAVYLEAARKFDENRVAGRIIDADDLFRLPSPDSPTQAQAELHLKYLHWRVDAEVLRLYALPADLERRLLDMFTGVERRGVPFKQREYFPAHFTDLQRLEDLLAITGDWEETSTRKTALIEKKIAKTATEPELRELDRLKMLTEARGELFAPLPLPHLDAMNERLAAKGQWTEKA